MEGATTIDAGHCWWFRWWLRTAGVTAMLLLNACTTLPLEQTLVLDYHDFGPQAMAYRLLGPNSLPWAPHSPLMLGESEVRVVVYRDLDLEIVKNLYPADRLSNIDYRFIEYSVALNYLDSRIRRNLLAKVTDRLTNTRARIYRALNAP